jgi:hypothetical protein
MAPVLMITWLPFQLTKTTSGRCWYCGVVLQGIPPLYFWGERDDAPDRTILRHRRHGTGVTS